MNASKKTKSAYFNYIGSIELPIDVYEQCYHQGDCTNDVNECMELPEVKAELAEINPEKLKKELREFGAWDEDALKNHKDNLARILWIAAGDIMDGK